MESSSEGKEQHHALGPFSEKQIIAIETQRTSRLGDLVNHLSLALGHDVPAVAFFNRLLRVAGF
ncbi:MAG: hypothetical protein ACK4MF_05895 [Hyphomicrobiaceae bacterium]